MEENTVKTSKTFQELEQDYNDYMISNNRKDALAWHIKTYGTTYVPRPQWSRPELEQTASMVIKTYSLKKGA